MIHNKLYIQITLSTTLLIIVAIIFIIAPNRASAAYNGANIISNDVFLNSNSMTKEGVQSFLSSNGSGLANRSFVLNCYAQDSKERQWYSAVGAPCDQSIPASHIIYYASQIYGINPQAVLATLQKEQSLVTSPNPTEWQINQAMGYACPTSGQCGGTSTFPYQIDSGVWVLRYHYERARGNLSWWSPSTTWTCGTEKNFYKPNLYPGQNVRFYDENNVLYRTHFIENAATSSLYCYTPHAYNNPQGLYGREPFGTTGLYYSGSYNFVYWFEKWFGDTAGLKPYTNIDWKFEYLDGSSEGVNPNVNTVGSNPETIVFNGVLYTFYYDSTNQDLLVSYADNTGWHRSVIDGQGGTGGRINAAVGREISAIVHSGELHIFYYNLTNASLRHATLNTTGNTWTFETIDGEESSVSGFVADVGNGSTALSRGQSIQLFYYDSTNGNLRHAWTNSIGDWKFENLDGDYGSVAGYNSNIGQTPIVLEHLGFMQLFYYDSGHGNLRHAWSSSQGWKFEILDGDLSSVSRKTSNVGYSIGAVSRGANGLQLFYYDSGRGNLRHAWTSSQGWRFEDFDGDPKSVSKFSGNIGMFPVTIVYNNKLYVFYRDAGAGNFRYSWSDSNGWRFATLEGEINSTSGITSDTGFWPTATVLNNSLQLYYFDNTARALRHTWGNDL